MRLAVIFLLAVAFAGCAGPDGPNAPEVRAAPTVWSWDLVDCEAWFWSVPVSPDALAPHLPAGFVPLGAPGPYASLYGDAFIGFERYRCATVEGPFGTAKDMAYGTLITRVRPPPELLEEGVSEYYYKWHVLVGDEAMRADWAAVGLPVHDGAVGLERPTALTTKAVVELVGLGTFDVEATAGDPQSADWSGPMVEFTPLPDGSLAVYRATFTQTTSGEATGMASVSAGSWPADAIGATTERAVAYYGRWSIVDGTITIPRAVAP